MATEWRWCCSCPWLLPGQPPPPQSAVVTIGVEVRWDLREVDPKLLENLLLRLAVDLDDGGLLDIAATRTVEFAEGDCRPHLQFLEFGRKGILVVEVKSVGVDHSPGLVVHCDHPPHVGLGVLDHPRVEVFRPPWWRWW